MCILAILSDLMNADDLISNHSSLTFASLISKSTITIAIVEISKLKSRVVFCVYNNFLLTLHCQVDIFKIF